jgi:hypothetical protein
VIKKLFFLVWMLALTIPAFGHGDSAGQLTPAANPATAKELWLGIVEEYDAFNAAGLIESMKSTRHDWILTPLASYSNGNWINRWTSENAEEPLPCDGAPERWVYYENNIKEQEFKAGENSFSPQGCDCAIGYKTDIKPEFLSNTQTAGKHGIALNQKVKFMYEATIDEKTDVFSGFKTVISDAFNKKEDAALIEQNELILHIPASQRHKWNVDLKIFAMKIDGDVYAYRFAAYKDYGKETNYKEETILASAYLGWIFKDTAGHWVIENDEVDLGNWMGVKGLSSWGYFQVDQKIFWVGTQGKYESFSYVIVDISNNKAVEVYYGGGSGA